MSGIHMQLDQVGQRIALNLDAESAVMLIESICAGMRAKYGDDRLGEILPVLREGRDMLNELISVEADVNLALFEVKEAA